MIQPLPANAVRFSQRRGTGVAKRRRAQIVLGEEDRRRLERRRSEEFPAFLDLVADGHRMAERPPRLDVPFNPDLGVVDACRQGLLLEAREAAAQACDLRLDR